MNLFETSPMWALWLLSALLAAAAIQDAVSLRISNVLTGTVLVLAIVAMAVSGFQLGLWQNLAVFLIVLGVGTLLFSNNVLGGGDVKLLAALSLWTDFPTALRLVVSICIAGGLLALLIITLRSVVPAKAREKVKTLQPGAGIPYGIAIGLGALVVIGMIQLGARDATYNSDIKTVRI